MTRSILAAPAVALALAAALPAASPPAQAAPYWPWCSRYFNRSNAESCAFSSWAQCMETVSGIGGYCYHNLYPPPAYRSERTRRRDARG